MIVVALLVEYVQRILLEMEIRRRAGNWQKLFYGKKSTAIRRAIVYSDYRKYLYAVFVCSR